MSRTPRELIYLDNAATSFPKAPGVGDAIRATMDRPLGNPGRGAHLASTDASRIVEQTRAALASLVGSPRAERIILTSGATEALNIALQGVVRARRHTDPARACHIVATALEHNAVLRPLEALRLEGAIELDIVPFNQLGFVEPDTIRRAARPDTTLVAATHASNVLGAIQPIAELGAALREVAPQALLLVDAAQTAGLLEIDVNRLGADLLAFGGHKSLLGPAGTGALFVGDRAYSEHADAPAILPLTTGGTGAESESPTHPRVLPTWLECGTANLPGLAGLRAALDFDRSHALDHERALAQRLVEQLTDVRGVRILGETEFERRTGVISLTIDACPSEEAAAILDDAFSIAARAGLHCAPLTHRSLNTAPQGALRFSPGPFTTADHIDAAADAVRQIASDA